MSTLFYSGYGYSKITCKNVVFWFLNKYYPRHKIDVDIIHRGMKREGVYGYCDVTGDLNRPRHFLIEIQSHMCDELYIKTLFHELTHLAQWVSGSLRFRYGKMCYSQEPVEKYDYWDQPHEIEARESEDILYDLYMSDKEGVAVSEVAQNGFQNRLIAL
jgi:hypothetical protein